MEKVRIGVVGLGWVAQVVHLPILMKLPEAEVSAICDRDRNRANLVAEKFGIKRLYSDANELAQLPDIEAVIVCTSTDAHKEATIAALKAGKDVLVEKPIARQLSEAIEMAEAAKQAKRKLMVGMNHRFRPDTMILRSFVSENELGKVFYSKGGWLRSRTTDNSWTTQKEKSGGGVLMDLGIVMIDMACWMLGYPDVRRVSATHFHNKMRDVEDTSLVNIGMKNGAIVNIEVSWSMVVPDDLYYFHVYGTEGSASLNPLRLHKQMHGNIVNVAPAKMDPPQHLFKRSYENELKHFLGAVRDIHPVISTADEAVQRMRIVDAIYKSVKSGKDVLLS